MTAAEIIDRVLEGWDHPEPAMKRPYNRTYRNRYLISQSSPERYEVWSKKGRHYHGSAKDLEAAKKYARYVRNSWRS